MKYRNIRTKGYDSKKEYSRSVVLKSLEKSGHITDLREQVSFILQEGYMKGKHKVRPIAYVADFVYLRNGETIVEDVKGVKTEVYKIKKKLFEFKYPYSITET